MSGVAPAPVAEPVATPTDRDLALMMGAALIRQCEGCTLHPVPDTPPHWQIGYGCNYLADGSPVRPTTPPLADIAAAEALLQAILRPLAAEVDREIRMPVSANQRAALYSFTWNEGIGALQASTLLRLVNEGRTQTAADEFPKWIYAAGRKMDGLVRRRALEQAVFLGKVAP